MSRQVRFLVNLAWGLIVHFAVIWIHGTSHVRFSEMVLIAAVITWLFEKERK